jgi:hypothetical protein
MRSDHKSLLMHTEVRWLSKGNSESNILTISKKFSITSLFLGNALFRLYELRSELTSFLRSLPEYNRVA